MNPEIQAVALIVTFLGFVVSVAVHVNNITKAAHKDDIELRDKVIALEHRDDSELRDRIISLETKMGLLWGLVEEHMTKLMLNANPLQFTEDEKAAQRIYDRQKSSTPTAILRKLEYAIERELRKHSSTVPADEMFVFVVILSAIKAQLVDRGESVTKSVLQGT